MPILTPISLIAGWQPMLALNFDTIVFLVIVVVSVLGKMFGKQDKTGEEWVDADDDEWQEDTKLKQRKTGGVTDWEEEMRRLLQGDMSRDPGSVSPPPLVQPAEKAAPPPMPIIVPARKVSLAELSESKASQERAKGLHDEVVRRLDDIDRQTREHAAALEQSTKRRRRKGPSGDALAVVKMLSSPRTARQAIIASIILSPSKAFEEPA